MIDHRNPLACCLALPLLILSGCNEKLGDSHSNIPSPAAAKLATDSHTHQSSLKFKNGQSFDFGPVLARGQTLTHDFELSNPTDKPIVLTSAISSIPCCSKVLPTLPVLAKTTGKVTIEFKPGFQTGQRRLTFEVHTDEPSSPAFGFEATAELTSALDLKIYDNSDRSLPLNRKGRQTFEIACRSIGVDGRGPLTTVEASTPLSVEFIGKSVEATTSTGIRQTTRTFAVDLPASSTVGLKRGQFDLIWADGTRETQWVSWTVEPLVLVHPSGLTIHESEGIVLKDFLLRASDRAFRVLDVAGPILADVPSFSIEPSQFHHLKLNLDASRPMVGSTSEIVIRTDHPDHQSLSITVLILPENQGRRP